MLSSNSARLWAKSEHAYFLAGMAVLPCLQSQFANYHKITWGHSQFRNLWEKDHNFHLVCDFSIIFPNDFYGLNLVFPRFKASTWFSPKCSLSSLELALKVLSSKVTTLIFFPRALEVNFPFICSTDISENPYVGFCSQVTANHVKLTCLLFWTCDYAAKWISLQSHRPRPDC